MSYITSRTTGSYLKINIYISIPIPLSSLSWHLIYIYEMQHALYAHLYASQIQCNVANFQHML